MYSSQLLLVLKSFQKEDLTQFDKYLHSPYFHNKKLAPIVFRFWQYLRDGLEKQGEEYFERQQVYQSLFPAQKIIKSKLEKLMSQMYTEVKSFLLFQQFRKQTGKQKKRIYLMAAFSDRELSGPFQQLYKKAKKRNLKKDERWSAEFFYEQFLLESQLSSFQSLYNNRETDLNLPNTHFYLDLCFLVQKLEYAFQLLARKMFIFPVNDTESLNVLDAIIPTLPLRYLEIPLIQIYLEAYRVLQFFYKEKGEKHHLHFNQLLTDYDTKMPFKQLKTLQALNRSYLMVQYKKNSERYLEQLFHLYQKHLQQGFLYEKGQIFPGILSNMVLIGLRNKAFDWVHRFLVKHKDRIGGTQNPDIVFQYNLAQYYFCIQAFEKALESIANTYDDPFYKVAARRLEVKIYYEMDSVIFESKLTAFKLYIYRLVKTSVHSDKMVGNHHFIDLLKQIWRPNTYKNHNRIDKLLAKTHQTKSLADKEWIIEKLEALR